jgi:hypothetical protein
MSKIASKPWQIHAAGSVLILLLAGGAYWLQIGPALSRHELAEAQAADLSSQKSKQRELERTLVMLKEKVSVAEREAGKAEMKLEPITELNARLARLTELAAGKRLRVDSVRISGQGTYRNCAALLREIQTARPDVAVVSLEMGSAAVTTDAAATFAFDLLWYTRPAEPGVKK